MTPSGNPIAVPRSHGRQERFQSWRVIKALPFMGTMLQPVFFARPAMYSASPIANKETITVTVSIPSIACKFPKVKRTAPDCRSDPTKPRVKPTPNEARPRSIELPRSVPTVVKAMSINAK